MNDKPDSPIPLTESTPAGLTQDELNELKPVITEFHDYRVNPGQCSSLLGQRVYARAETVWSILRRFDEPQTYKHFIKSCNAREGFSMTVGDLRDVSVISGLPAATSTERLDMMDEGRRVTGFSIIGGDHRLKNYRSVTSVHEVAREGTTVVLESYVVDVPDGNTEEDTRLFADTVVRLNLQKLAAVAETGQADYEARRAALEGGESDGSVNMNDLYVEVAGTQKNRIFGTGEIDASYKTLVPSTSSSQQTDNEELRRQVAQMRTEMEEERAQRRTEMEAERAAREGMQRDLAAALKLLHEKFGDGSGSS